YLDVPSPRARKRATPRVRTERSAFAHAPTRPTKKHLSALPKLDGFKPSSSLLAAKDAPCRRTVRRKVISAFSHTLALHATSARTSQCGMRRCRELSTALDQTEHMGKQRMVAIGAIKSMVTIGPVHEQADRSELSQLVLHGVQ